MFLNENGNWVAYFLSSTKIIKLCILVVLSIPVLVLHKLFAQTVYAKSGNAY